MKLNVVEEDRNYVRLKRHKVGNAADFGIGVGVGPCRLTSVANRIIAAEPFVGTERLKLYRCEGGLVDVITRDIPAWSEPGFVKAQWMPGIHNDAVVVADHEVTRTVSNIYAMVWVGSMTQDSFVFLIEGIHGAPCERQSSLEFCCMGREVRVLPRSSDGHVLLAYPDSVP